MKYRLFIRMVTLFCLTLSTGTMAEMHQFTYAWPYEDSSTMKPRGGTSKGASIELDEQTSEAWSAISQPDLKPVDRDRRAILAMAGAYRASFDFLETVGFTQPYEPKQPYQSWGTEYVYVVTNEPRFISLQHILVMRVELENGNMSEPMVVKHWRQDWQYQDRSLHTYQGHQSWSKQIRKRSEVRGQWTQAVYQVDDSPRYEGLGQWIHLPNYSSWQSNETWRPLPRREFSVRQDYDVLIGKNRHIITPSGWVHEEENLKVVLDENAKIDQVIARETGFNRYERIVNFDFSAGDTYWNKTQLFWADVAEAWSRIYKLNDNFSIKKKHEGKTLIGKMFGYTSGINEVYDQAAGKAFIQSTLNDFVIRSAK